MDRRTLAIGLGLAAAAASVFLLFVAPRGGPEADPSAAGAADATARPGAGPAADPSGRAPSRPGADADAGPASAAAGRRVAAAGLGGVVVDPLHTPVAGASVRVRRSSDGTVPGGEVAAAEAGADGTFFFDALPDGALELAASAEGYAPVVTDVAARGGFVEVVLAVAAVVDVRVVDGAGRAVPGASVAYRSGGAEGRIVATADADAGGRVRLAVPPGQGTVLGRKDGVGTGRTSAGVFAGRSVAVGVVLRGGAVLSGTVTDAADGRPLEGVQVAVTRPADEGGAGPTAPVVATTDATGRYRAVLDVGPGELLDLLATHAGYAAVRARFPYGDGVGAGRCDLRLGRGAAPVTGRVVGPDGAGIVGVRVGFARTATGLDDEGVVSGPDGGFRLPVPAHVAPGAVATVVARGRGGLGSASVLVRQVAAPPAEPLVLHLTGAGVVRGRVVDGAGQAVPGATVASRFDITTTQKAAAAAGEKSEAWRALQALQDRRARAAYTVTTDAAGRFVVEALPAGDWMLDATCGGLGGRTPVQVAAGATVDVTVTLEPGARVEGTVRDGRGEPVAGAAVWALGPRAEATVGSEARTTSGPDGRFALVRVPRGPLTVHAAATGFTSASARDVAVGTRDLTLSLTPRARLRGQVQRDGRGADGAFTVTLRHPPRPPPPGRPAGRGDGDAVRSFAFADAEGRFEAPDVREGRCFVSAATVDGSEASDEVEVVVVAGGSAPVVLALQRGATVRGTVVSRRGQALAGARLTARGGAGPAVRATADGAGAFELRGLPRGAVAVAIEADGTVPWAEALELRADEARDVRWTAPEPGRVRFVVVDDTGAPVAGARPVLRDALGFEVHATPDDLVADGLGDPSSAEAWARATTTGADGRLRSPWTSPGRYRATVARPGGPATAPVEVVVAAGEEAEVRLVAPPSLR